VPEQSRVNGGVRELRVAITVADVDAALRFFRDELGIAERRIDWQNMGRLALLDVDHATLEIIDEVQAAYIDEVEVGRRVAGRIRLGFHVDDTTATTARIRAIGGDILGDPSTMPWGSLNARVIGPGGIQLTIWSEPN